MTIGCPKCHKDKIFLIKTEPVNIFVPIKPYPIYVCSDCGYLFSEKQIKQDLKIPEQVNFQ